MRVAHTEALILLLLYPFGIVAWDPRVGCVSGGHGNPADLFPLLTWEAGVTASLPWLHPHSVKTQPFGIPNKNLSALNSASEAWLEQKGVHISKSAQLSPYLGNAAFPLGGKWRLNLLATELNLQSSEPLSCACTISVTILGLWKWVLFQCSAPAVFSKPPLIMQLWRQDTSHVAACLLQLPRSPANDKQKSFV